MKNDMSFPNLTNSMKMVLAFMFCVFMSMSFVVAQNAHAVSVVRYTNIKNPEFALGAPDSKVAKMEKNNSEIILKLDGIVKRGTNISFRIKSTTNGNGNGNGSINASAFPTLFSSSTRVLVSKTRKSYKIYTILALQPGIQYVKITGDSKFQLESVTFTREMNRPSGPQCTAGAVVGTPTAGDSDGDGINDICDLDSDNDGILDSVEQTLNCTMAKQPQFTGQPTPIGTSSLSNPQQGHSFRYSNVYSGVDAIVTVVALNGDDIVNFDVTSSGYDQNFQPRINHATATSFTEFKIEFVNSGTTTAAPLDNYMLTTIDNDVDEFVTYMDGYSTGVIVDTPTNNVPYTGQPANAGGFSQGYVSDGTFVSGVSTDTPGYQVAAMYSGISSVSIRFGSTRGATSNHSMSFDACLSTDEWTTQPVLFADFIDTDGDGIYDHLDLDSDGDGCPDAIEGAGNFSHDDLIESNMNGGNTGGAFNGTSPSPVVYNLGVEPVNSDGVLDTVGAGQAEGTSKDPSTNNCATDLRLIKTVANAAGTIITSANVGETIYYTITVFNESPYTIPVTDIVVKDYLPTGVTYNSGASIIPGGTTFSITSTTGTWDLGSTLLAQGTSIALTIAVDIGPNCDDITNTAEIFSATPSEDIDSTPGNLQQP